MAASSFYQQNKPVTSVLNVMMGVIAAAPIASFVPGPVFPNANPRSASSFYQSGAVYALTNPPGPVSGPAPTGSTVAPASFYKDGGAVYTDTNASVVDTPVLANAPNVTSASSFYKGAGVLLVGSEANFEIAISVAGGTLGSNEWLYGYEFDFTGLFLANFSGSEAFAGNLPSGSPVISVNKNGVQFGTITFTGSSATFSCVQTTFNPGDRLELIAPIVPDLTLAHISISLQGQRVI